jgi:hypothetical protein
MREVPMTERTATATRGAEIICEHGFRNEIREEVIESEISK